MHTSLDRETLLDFGRLYDEYVGKVKDRGVELSEAFKKNKSLLFSVFGVNTFIWYSTQKHYLAPCVGMMKYHCKVNAPSFIKALPSSLFEGVALKALLDGQKKDTEGNDENEARISKLAEQAFKVLADAMMSGVLVLPTPLLRSDMADAWDEMMMKKAGRAVFSNGNAIIDRVQADKSYLKRCPMAQRSEAQQFFFNAVV